jgi:hypothetical protein
MTIDQLIALLVEHPAAVACLLVVSPVAAAGTGVCHTRDQGNDSPWKYVYMLLIYLACVPGIFAAVLAGYLFLFQGLNLLKLDLVVHFLPIAMMIVTLALINRKVRSFDGIPGFGRLSGLMLLLAISFAAAFALHRMHFGIVFFGSLGQFVLIAVAAFALLKWSARKMAGSEKHELKDALQQDTPEDN